ncbi:MAG: hypothetical protein ACFB10_00875 [Salibacteraceae bacterium]
MRFLFYLGHPAHYHNIAQSARLLAERGHDILLVARQKDVLLELVKDAPFPVIVVARNEASGGKLARIWTLLKRAIKMLAIALRFRPHLMAGTDPIITYVGKLLGIKTVVINEDDADQVPLFAKSAYPYATAILVPQPCWVGAFEAKTTRYAGYHELAYLHPRYFTPDQKRVSRLFQSEKPYFILRFAKLTAHHDDGRTGITTAIAQELVDRLTPFGQVYITSERPLETQFEKYRIRIAPRDMHHAMAFANLYIGDSQTMAAEAAVLGTPSLRFNDFVGKLAYLDELEERFGLTKGIPTNQPEKLLESAAEWAQRKEIKQEWAEKRIKMLEACIDVAEFWAEFMEQLPQKKS